MANLYYRDRLIIAFTSIDHSSNLWSGGAEISWKRDGERHSYSIGGLADRFKTSEEAETFIVNLAKTWIDADG